MKTLFMAILLVFGASSAQAGRDAALHKGSACIVPVGAEILGIRINEVVAGTTFFNKVRYYGMRHNVYTRAKIMGEANSTRMYRPDGTRIAKEEGSLSEEEANLLDFDVKVASIIFENTVVRVEDFKCYPVNNR